MLKNVLAVIAGYLVMLVFIFVVFTGLYLAIGADRAFEPGTYEVSVLWLVISLTLSLVAAILGGYVCAAIGNSSAAARSLAILVIVLGIISAWPALDPAKDPRPNVRIADVPNMEAMMNARQPPWVAISLPFIGAAGVLIGAARVRRRP